MMKIMITSMTRTISIKNYIKLFSVIGLFSFIFIYSLFQTRSIKNGVLLQVNNIENGIETIEEIFPVEGNAKHASKLLVNGREILIDKENNFKTDFVVAVDSVGAGVGEIVLCATGSSARQTNQTKDKPVDAVIMAIVDKLDVSVKS